MPLTLHAAFYKASCTISYADAFAAALVKPRKAELVTGDREFRQVERGKGKVDRLKNGRCFYLSYLSPQKKMVD